MKIYIIYGMVCMKWVGSVSILPQNIKLKLLHQALLNNIIKTIVAIK